MKLQFFCEIFSRKVVCGFIEEKCLTMMSEFVEEKDLLPDIGLNL